MSKSKKRILATIITILVTAATLALGATNVKALYSVGEKLWLGYNDYCNGSSGLLCVEHGQRLWSEGRKYTVVSRIHIEGQTSTDHKGKSIDNRENAKLAYILSVDRPGGDPDWSEVQNAVWNNIAGWVSQVGQHHAGISSSFAITAKGYHTRLEDRADDYADSGVADNKIENKTNEDKIKVEAYKNNDQASLKIGPFNIEFSGTLTDVKLSDKKGKTISPSAYGVYSGSKFKTIGLNEVESGKNFYIVIPANSGMASINHIKMTSSSDVKVADIAFLECADYTWQNLIQYSHSEKTVNTDGNWDVTINLLINISGYVWEDMASGKTGTAYDNVYHGENFKIGNDEYDGFDVLVEGITVRLKDKDGNIIKNNEGKEAVAKTDSNGSYKFTDILISDLEGCYVEFEYDGLTYTSVKALVEQESNTLKNKAIDPNSINSKSLEVESERKEVNARFTEITNKDNISNRSQGYSRSADGKATGTLKYKNDTANWQSTFESATTDKDLTANTKAAKYDINEQFEKENYVVNDDGTIEIKYINLGIVKREQPHIGISNDINNVEVTVNGYSHNYIYSQRAPYVENKTGFNVAVKFASKFANRYSRAIYPSDVQYSKTDATDANKLRVYVTYVITLRNMDENLQSSVNELVNYYDKEYTIVDSWVGDDTNNKITWNNSSKYGQKYSDGKYIGAYTTGLADKKIAGGQNSDKVYIKFQVSDNAVLGLLNGNATLNNTVEVNSYSTYYGDKKRGAESGKKGDIYAAIDRVSAPGNAKPGDTSTYESDTDGAPSLILEAKGVREIVGTVFEDKTADGLQSEKERKGDGIYNDGENTIGGVTVELIASNGDVARIYPNAADDNGNAVADTDGQEAKLTTGADGYYIFKGVEPDTYLLKYTYQNGTTKIYNTKGKEVKDITVQDYKSTILTSSIIKQAFEDNNANLDWYKKEVEKRYSDARDDYEQREAIDNEIMTIDGATTATITSLNANSPKFDMGVEYETVYSASSGDAYTYRVSNVDFGIARRPMQSATLDKHVRGIKVTLQNGQTIIGGADGITDEDKDGDGYADIDIAKGIAPKYVTIAGNKIYVTLDSELLYGSHVEIKYNLTLSNTSELDYRNKAYYYYGDDTSNPVKLSSATLVDYVDSELILQDGQGGTWNVLDMAEKGYNWNLTPEQEEALLKQYSTVVKAEAIPDKDIAPGESTVTPIIAEKLLSTSDNELSYENNGEVVQIGKTGGSTMTTTLGSYALSLASNPEAEPEESDEVKAETTSIIPPTGDNNNTVTYIIIGVTSLAILGAGTYTVRRIVKL